MAAINGHLAFATLLSALSGGLDRPPNNWNEITVHQPPALQASHTLNQQGQIGDNTTPSMRKKISPADFFRIVELAPHAIRSSAALTAPPKGNEAQLHIRTGDGKDFYFAADQDHLDSPDAQEIWDILKRYRN